MSTYNTPLATQLGQIIATAPTDEPLTITNYHYHPTPHIHIDGPITDTINGHHNNDDITDALADLGYEYTTHTENDPDNPNYDRDLDIYPRYEYTITT